MISINKFNYFRKKNRSESETREETFADAPQTVRKKPSERKWYLMLFLLLAGAGFAAVSYVMPFHNEKAEPVNRQFSGALPGNNPGSNLWLNGQSAIPSPQPQLSQAPSPPHAGNAPQTVMPGPVQEKKTIAASEQPLNTEKKKQKAEVTGKAKDKEVGRNVFKDFYVKNAGQVMKASEKNMEKKLPELSKFINGGGLQNLPPVSVVNTPPVEQPKEIRIYGITCAGNANDSCVAITNEGILKEGDKIGIETVSTVDRKSLVTDKRTVDFN